VNFCTDISKFNSLLDQETPFFVWDLEVLRRRIYYVHETFSCISRFRLFYAMKANPSVSIIRHIASMGGNVDVCTINELRVALESGIPPERISACPFVPSKAELDEFIQAECDIDLDSLEDVKKWCETAANKKTIGLRINPDVKAGFHEHCASGVWDSKFGIPISDIPEAIKITRQFNRSIHGVHIHIGSSSYETTQYLIAIERVLRAIQQFDLKLNYINIGGGWGIPFHTQDDGKALERFPLQEYAHAISSLLKQYQISAAVELRAEPGEYLVGPCGFLICTVRRVIERQHGFDSKRIAVLDGGTYLYPGPSIYGSDNFIILLNRKEEDYCKQILAGRSMLAGDIFGPERIMPILKPRDIIGIGAAGAYSIIKSTNFNLLPSAMEYSLNG
jgi:diaminopimelate decarboxylase